MTRYQCIIFFIGVTLSVKSHANSVDRYGMEAKTPETMYTLTDSNHVHDIDEVVVVAQAKDVFQLRKQAISSTSFGSYEMQKLNVCDLRDLSLYVPNFVMPKYGTRLTSAMYVRGIGNRMNSPAVGIYLDGIPVMSKAALNLHNYQLSRVDVLRGPQGTLYGQNTEGGLVRQYSRDPFLNEGTDVKLSCGSKFYRNMEVAHYQKFSDNVALSVAGFYEGQTGFFHNTNTGADADKYNETGVKFLLKTRLNAGWTIDFLGNYQYVDQNGFPYGKLNRNTGNADLPESTFTGTYLRNNFLAGLNIGYHGEHFLFTTTGSYQFLKDRMLMDQDYLAPNYMHITQAQLQNSYTQEFSLRSAHPVGGFWHWSAGVFFSAQWLRTDAPVYFDEALTLPIASAIQVQMYNAMVKAMAARMEAQGMSSVAALTTAQTDIEKGGGVSLSVDMAAPGKYHTPQYNLGFFHESNFDVTSRLTATLGLRFDYLLTKIHYESSAYMAMAADVMGKEAIYTLTSSLDGKADDYFNQLLPKFGLCYRIDNHNSNVYVTISKGYRMGGYNFQMFSDILQVELNSNRSNVMRGDFDVPHTDKDYENIKNTIAYQPETSWNYEIGTHLNIFDETLLLDLCAFYMQVRNQQLSVMAGTYGYGRMMVNAGRSHSCGIETSLRGKLLDGDFDWGVNYGYTHAIFDEYNESVNNSYVSYADKYVPYVPQHTFSAFADYQMGTGKRVLKNIVFGANVNAQGMTYWDNSNSYAQKFYAVLGAHFDADFGVLICSFWGRNITNTKYNTFALDSSATGTKQYFAQRGNPFQCGLDVKLHF